MRLKKRLYGEVQGVIWRGEMRKEGGWGDAEKRKNGGNSQAKPREERRSFGKKHVK